MFVQYVYVIIKDTTCWFYNSNALSENRPLPIFILLWCHSIIKHTIVYMSALCIWAIVHITIFTPTIPCYKGAK